MTSQLAMPCASSSCAEGKGSCRCGRTSPWARPGMSGKDRLLADPYSDGCDRRRRLVAQASSGGPRRTRTKPHRPGTTARPITVVLVGDDRGNVAHGEDGDDVT